MNVNTDRKHLLLAGLFTALLFVGIALNSSAFFNGSTQYDIAFFCTSGLLAMITGMIAAIRFEWKGRTGTIINLLFFLLAPVLTMQMLECLDSVFIYDFSPKVFGANYIVYLMLYLILYAICGNLCVAIYVLNPLLFIAGIVNFFVTSFRGSPIVPFDLFTISTGLNVSSNYTYSVHYTMVLSALLLILLLVCATKFRTPHPAKRIRILSRAISMLAILAMTIGFFQTDVAADHGLRPDFWDQSRGYRNNGTLLSFCLNTKYIKVHTPDSYQSNEITDLVTTAIADKNEISGSSIDDYQNPYHTSKASKSQRPVTSSQLKQSMDELLSNSDRHTDRKKDTAKDLDPAQAAANAQTDTDPASDTKTKDNTSSEANAKVDTNSSSDPKKVKDPSVRPNIICIMNESLSDLSILGDLHTNMDYMPFMHSLKENTIRGNLYVPVNGAGTSNTEFEFLTGNSLAFLPAGANVYQLYIDDELPSLATTLGDLGYSKTAFHPYYASGWNRPKVYPLMGFEDFVTIEDMIDPKILEAYQNSDNNVSILQQLLKQHYPDKDMLLRRYISDDYDFDQIISMYEAKKKDTPMFLFNVTMQNHGGYMLSYSNFFQKIYLQDMSEHYSKANRYLSLVYESDQAFEKLINYFKKQDEPTIICMFGDHQPYLETEFFEELLGNDLNHLNIQQTQDRYVTPFFIWANYDIQEQYIDKISSNYLSTLLLETAGLPLTDYNQYLSDLYQSLPVIDSIGCIDKTGTYYSKDEASPYKDLLAEYEKIQYNNLFDTKNRANSLFYLENSKDADQ